jgi:hypothetical protein
MVQGELRHISRWKLWAAQFLFAAKYGAQPLMRELSTIQSRQRKFSNHDGRNRAVYLRASSSQVRSPLEAAQIIEATDHRAPEASLHSLRGFLLNATGDPSAAERSYHQAIAVAKLQSAKFWELRASINLARLWYQQDRRGEARNLLAPIYG